jgi:ribonucleoside-diphosphate reductase alpha chain
MPDAIGLALEEWFRDKQGVQQELLAQIPLPPVDATVPPVAMVNSDGEQLMMGGMSETFAGACPDCGSQLEYAEGCAKCHVCGFSECG